MATKRKNPFAVGLGKLGARQRNKRLTPEERSAIARKAIAARWKQQTPEQRSASAKKGAATRKRNREQQ